MTSFALVFSFLSPIATPQLSLSFAQDRDYEIPVFRAPKTPEALEGEFLVKYRDTQSFGTLSTGAKPLWAQKLGEGVEIDSRPNKFNIAHVTVQNPNKGNWENLANVMSSDPNIASVEPNYIYQAFENRAQAGGDPKEEKLWFLDMIGARQAWQKVPAAKEEDIIVAVLDTGVQYDHDDLVNNIWRNPKEIPDNLKDDDSNGYVDDVHGWNFVENNQLPYSYKTPLPVLSIDPETGDYRCSPDPTVSFYENHGSHVAGTIAAVHDNNEGIKGIARNVKIMPVRVIGGTCRRGDVMNILRGILYAVENGATIINLSLGGSGRSELMAQAFEMLSREGILVVAAAGNSARDNDGKGRAYPASYPSDGIISVAATDHHDKLAEFSNYGRNNVDIAAPGVDIYSTIPRDRGIFPGSGYGNMRGTSMSAPMVAGAAALIWAQNPQLTNIQVKQKLLSSVDPVQALNGKILTGGRLNIAAALNSQTMVNSRPNRPAIPSNQRTQTPAKNTSQPVMPSSVGGIRIYDNRKDSSDKMRW